MFLFLLRHATAENTSVSGKDFDRSLSPVGLAQAKLLGEYISRINLINTDFYISSSQRTKETSVYAINKYLASAKYFNQLYLASSTDLLKFINEQNSTNNLLIIGHNEGISALASYLTDQYVGLNTANFVTIAFDCKNSNEISGGMGRVIDFFNPL